MNCSACRSALDISDTFCRECGALAGDRSCPNCQRPIRQGARFCAHCGHSLVGIAGAAERGQTARPATERKLVTLLCADLFQSTALIEGLDPEDAIALLEPALNAMRIAVRRFRGIISKELGDGVLAVFGAPLASDDHAVRACHAALDLTRQIELLDRPDIRVRVGLHAGYVLTHTIKGDFSSMYEAGGPAAHLVNRIEQAAEVGQIYASESCRALAEEYLTFEPLTAMSLKGFSHPVPLYRLTGISPRRRWQVRAARTTTSFVGRSADIAALEQAAHATRSGTGIVVSIVGEPGVGKSRLVHEFTDALARETWIVIEAEASPMTQESPYALIRALIEPLLGMAQLPQAGLSSPALTAGFSPQWLAAIDAVLGRPVTDRDLDTLDAAARRRAVVDACRALVERLAQHRPTAILIEDIHWIDESSAAVIAELASLAETTGILILTTSRTADAPAWPARTRQIRLDPLDPDAARLLLDELLGNSPSLGKLKTRLLQHTGRIPLFIEEVVRRLAETGVVTGSPGHYSEARAIDDLGIPPTVQGVIAARIDRLPRREKELLQVISGVGDRTELSLIEALADQPAGELGPALDALEADGLLTAGTTAPRVYEFPHDLVREVAYDTILHQERPRLHARILAALEARLDGSANDSSDQLTHHAVRARLWSSAGAYAQLAAQKCLAGSALADATRFFEIALDATDRMAPSAAREARAIDLRLEARRAFSAYGKLKRWLELSAEAEQRAIAIADDTRALAASAVRAAAMNFYHATTDAIAAGERAVKRAEDLGADDWLTYAEYGLGQAYQTAGHYRHAERCLERAYTRLCAPSASVPFGSTTSLSLLCCMMKSIAHASIGEADAARSWQALAADLTHITRQPSDIIAADYCRGFYELRWGDITAAISILEHACDLVERHEIRYFAPVITCQLARGHLLAGNAARAQDLLQEAKHTAEALGHTYSVVRASTYLSMALASAGDVTGALQLARAACLTAEQQGFDGLKAEALVAQASALAPSRGTDSAEARRCLAAAIDVATRIEARPQLAAARAMLGDLLAREGDLESGERERAQAGSILSEIGLFRRADRIQYV